MANLEWTYRNDENGIRLEATDGTFEFVIERNAERVLTEEHILYLDGKVRSSVVNQSGARLIALANEISKTHREAREQGIEV